MNMIKTLYLFYVRAYNYARIFFQRKLVVNYENCRRNRYTAWYSVIRVLRTCSHFYMRALSFYSRKKRNFLRQFVHSSCHDIFIRPHGILSPHSKWLHAWATVEISFLSLFQCLLENCEMKVAKRIQYHVQLKDV